MKKRHFAATCWLLASSIILVLVLVCHKNGNGIQNVAALRAKTRQSHPIIVDFVADLKRLLLVAFDNNIELTNLVVDYLKHLPTSRESQDMALFYISRYLPSSPARRGGHIWVRTSPLRLSRIEDLMLAENSWTVAVVDIYLRELQASQYSPLKLYACDKFKPKTNLECCQTCCPKCMGDDQDDSLKPGPMARRTNSKQKIGPWRYRNSVSEHKYRFLLFSEAEIRELERNILGLHDDHPERRDLLRRFIHGLPRIVSSGNSRYLLYSIMASLGVPVSNENLEREHQEDALFEPGLLPIMDRLTHLVALQRQGTQCDVSVTCQRGKCSNTCESSNECLECPGGTSQGGVITRGPISPLIVSADFPTISEQPTPPPKIPNPLQEEDEEYEDEDEGDEVSNKNEGQNQKDKQHEEKTTRKPQNNRLVANMPEDHVDPNKLRLDFDNSSSLLEITDVVPKADILTRHYNCTADDATCGFKTSCGLAPLNPLTVKKSSPYVVAGEDQQYGEWPSFVRIEIASPQYVSFCGGTLITDRHVLTAAHCLWFGPVYWKQRANESAFTVIVGDHQVYAKDAYETHRAVEKICMASKYSPNGERERGGAHDDWAILTLSHPVQFNDYVQPACLPYEPVTRFGKLAKCFLVGAGVTGYSGHIAEQASVVQKLRVEQVSCRVWGLSDLDRSRECYSKVGAAKGDSCSGDSGGPVLCLDKLKRWTVVASVSYGTAKCDDTAYQAWVGVYARHRVLLQDMKSQCGI